jgi:DNA-binding response OmpR family regulator
MKKRHILLVDDDRELLELFEATLSSRELSITPCQSLSIAQHLLTRHDFDALVVDTQPGYEALIRCFLRNNPHAPAILLTGGITTEQERRAYDIGAHLVLYKPIGVTALRKNLHDEISAATQTLRPLVALKPDPELNEVLDQENLLLKAWESGDTARLDEMLSSEYVFAAGSPEAETKTERLQNLKAGRLKYRTVNTLEMHASHYQDVCIVTAIVSLTGERDGEDISGTYRSLRIYARKGHRWKAVAGQLMKQEAVAA